MGSTEGRWRPGGQVCDRQGKAGGSFLKKRTKKLFHIRVLRLKRCAYSEDVLYSYQKKRFWLRLGQD
jgi:hypothetical protein